MASPVLQLSINLNGDPDAVQLAASTKAGPVFVWVDEADAKNLKGRKVRIGSHGYCQLWDAGKSVLLHRWILGCSTGDGKFVDHRNGDPLDCRRANLRICTAAENAANRKTAAASGYKGVDAQGTRWRARAKRNGRVIHLGVYDTPEQAAQVSHLWRVQNLPGYLGRDITSKPVNQLSLVA